jgi:hypothetical protein
MRAPAGELATKVTSCSFWLASTTTQLSKISSRASTTGTSARSPPGRPTSTRSGSQLVGSSPCSAHPIDITSHSQRIAAP